MLTRIPFFQPPGRPPAGARQPDLPIVICFVFVRVFCVFFFGHGIQLSFGSFSKKQTNKPSQEQFEKDYPSIWSARPTVPP